MIAALFFPFCGLVALSDSQRRTAAERIREALRLAGLALSEAAYLMGIDPSELTRGLSGERKLDHWKLQLLPDEFHRHHAVLELRDRGLPAYARTCLKIGSLVKEKP